MSVSVSARPLRILLLLAALLAAGAAAIFLTSRAEPVDAVAEAARRPGVALESSFVETNGVRLHVVEAGPVDGAPVVLLHGFPEFWLAWEAQIAPLARAGFRVIVPDQRGHNASDKPAELSAYRLEALVGDVLGLLDARGHDRAYVAGHDLGASVAWRLVLLHPERVRAAVIFNANHPQAERDAEADDDKIGWHRTLAQVPYLPELVARFGNWALPVSVLRDTSRPGTFPDETMAAYRWAWHRDHAIAYMAMWMRAWREHPQPLPERAIAEPPVRLVWGLGDAFIPLSDPTPSLRLLRRGEVVQLPDAGHWLLHEEPEETSRLLVEFFRRH
ncbi:MAG: alpha/beta fold hydrolase [Myxococcota bacterium]